MFKKSKKVISIFLTLLFTITICPLEALAQTVSETKTYLVSTQSNQKYKKSPKNTKNICQKQMKVTNI